MAHSAYLYTKDFLQKLQTPTYSQIERNIRRQIRQPWYLHTMQMQIVKDEPQPTALGLMVSYFMKPSRAVHIQPLAPPIPRSLFCLSADMPDFACAERFLRAAN